MIFYQTRPGDPVLFLEADVNALGTGIAYPQTAGPFTADSFSGAYGVNFSSNNPPNVFQEDDGTGQLVADGVGTLSGIVDLNQFYVTSSNPFSGAFTASANGRFTGTITESSSTAQAFYFVDSTRGFLVETDNVQVQLGVFQQQQ